MATKKKIEDTQEEQVFDAENLTEKLPEETFVDKSSIYIPDIPAQMIDNSKPEEPSGETETEFLLRILNIQYEGGFGRHLDRIITERIKSLS